MEIQRRAREDRQDKMMETFMTMMGAALSTYMNNNNQGRGVARRRTEEREDNGWLRGWDTDSSYERWKEKRLKKIAMKKKSNKNKPENVPKKMEESDDESE
jgi:hypothetical protein